MACTPCPSPTGRPAKNEEFLTIDSAEGLLGMAQLAVLEIHPWGSKNGAVDKPDRIIFDLDPDEAITWPTLAAAAQELRSLLKQVELASYVKSTGGKGLHVVVAIEPEHEWPVIKQLSHAVVLKIEKRNPGLYTTNMLKAVRRNRIYLDYLRNDRESTAIAPFSTRARSGGAGCGYAGLEGVAGTRSANVSRVRLQPMAKASAPGPVEGDA